MEGLEKYKKVVFIDDDKDLIDLYNSKLESDNLSDYFISFDNVKEGIHYLEKAQKDQLPHYILLDLYLPEMNGFDFLKNIENMNKVKDSAEIYVCTASRNKDDRNQVMKYPFVSAFIEKPIAKNFIEFLITGTQ